MSLAFTLVPGSTPAFSPSTTATPFFLNPDISGKLLGEAEDAGFGGIVIDDRAGTLANFDLVEQAAASSVSANLQLTHTACPAGRPGSALLSVAADEIGGRRFDSFVVALPPGNLALKDAIAINGVRSEAIGYVD